MPEIDTDLFQLLSLVFLGIIVLIGLALLAAVGKLRKTLEKTSVEQRALVGASEAPQYYETPTPGLDAGVAEMPDTAAAEPAPTSEFEVATEEPAAGGPGVVPAEQPIPEAEPAQAAHERVAAAAAAETPAQSEPSAVEETAQPVGAATPEETAGVPAAEESAAMGAGGETAVTEEPEEQPFERGGRWWFRRGDELLVYDDASGQWQPAPAEAAPSRPATQGVPTTFGDVSQAETGGAEAPAETEEAAATAGSFWKCPSCGAVNGSTAAACRMCFTARP